MSKPRDGLPEARNARAVLSAAAEATRGGSKTVPGHMIDASSRDDGAKTARVQGADEVAPAGGVMVPLVARQLVLARPFKGAVSRVTKT